ncbi:MAG: hypothetical protein ABFS42_16300 [Candidatus Krumholzibacteriota bacterium]
MTRGWVILGLLASFSGCSDSTAPQNTPVDSSPSCNLREVPLVNLEHSPHPGEVEVSWWIISWATIPIEEYQVAFSLDGPITEANWDQARILGQYPHRKGQVVFRELFGATDGMVQGTETWFAVRARDIMGNLTPLKESPRLVTTTEWWVEGRVRDSKERTIAGILVRSPPTGATALSDPDGAFRLGPFRNIDRIKLVAEDGSSGQEWYGFTSGPIWNRSGSAGVTEHDIFLIPRQSIEPACILHHNEFLTYLRFMTFTSARDDIPRASILHRWDHYPLTVFIPPRVNDAGVRLDDGALAALLVWNDVMGEEYFVRTDQRAGADIEFEFEEMQIFYGKVSLLLPAYTGAKLGRVIPEKMRVSINPVLPDFQKVTEVALHELGHTLGLIVHATCPAPGYIMGIVGGFGALDRAEPIHLDERRAVEYIRYLPQGQDMNRYHLE